MRLEEFANVVLTEVRKKADGAFSAWITTNRKNNGIQQTAICANSPDSSGGPCVYLDDYYRAYRHGHMEIGEVAENVYQRIMEHRNDLRDVSVADFLQWDVIRHHIYAKLVNADMNKETLGMIPHRHFLDLAVVYYIKVSGVDGNEGMASILIQNNFMEMWGQSEESLYQMAVANMCLDGEPIFQDMAALLQGVMPEGVNPLMDEEIDVKMYVLTNRDKTFGAVEILDKNILQKISERLADDFIVLPSSIHETIIIPSNKAPEYSELADMVCVVNATQVDAEERLSNHVYRYDRSEGILKMAA